LLGRAQWDEEQLCQEVRQYGIAGLREAEDIFALDETGFLKQGSQSVGVQVQYYGTTGHERELPGGCLFSLRHW
jgi:SRSO17 transposase